MARTVDADELTREREAALARRAVAGDGRARDKLVEGCLPAIAALARHYRDTTHLGLDELMESGVLGLLRGLRRYDPERGTPFWAYASWWVREAMQQLAAERPYPVVLSDPALRAQLCGLPGGLEEREREVLRCHFALGQPRRTLAEIAVALGVSSERVRQIEARALEKLRFLARAGLIPGG
jgi:DNA-directed RNA polymerase sigma subunit (sigma70/sigma32)